MKTNELRYGLYMLAGFIAFFFTMKALGLYTNVELRFLNFFIHGSLVYFSMKAFRKKTGGDFEYLKTFGSGLRTSIIPVVGFVLFQFAYLQFLDPAFMLHIRETALMGDFLTPFKASIFLFFEGFGVTVFTSYIGMRLLTVQENVPSLS